MWNHNQKIRDKRETGKGEKQQEGEHCVIKRDNFLSKKLSIEQCAAAPGT